MLVSDILFAIRITSSETIKLNIEFVWIQRRKKKQGEEANEIFCDPHHHHHTKSRMPKKLKIQDPRPEIKDQRETLRSAMH